MIPAAPLVSSYLNVHVYSNGSKQASLTRIGLTLFASILLFLNETLPCVSASHSMAPIHFIFLSELRLDAANYLPVPALIIHWAPRTCKASMTLSRRWFKCTRNDR